MSTVAPKLVCALFIYNDAIRLFEAKFWKKSMDKEVWTLEGNNT